MQRRNPEAAAHEHQPPAGKLPRPREAAAQRRRDVNCVPGLQRNEFARRRAYRLHHERAPPVALVMNAHRPPHQVLRGMREQLHELAGMASWVLRPCARIMVLLFGFVPFSIGSAWVLGFWALMQVWNVVSAAGGDTAWWAHVGGFVAGAGLTLVFRRPDVPLFACLRPGDVLAVKQVPPPLKRRWGSR